MQTEKLMQVKYIKTVEGHLTATEKKAIKALLAAGARAGKIGRKIYIITENKGLFSVEKKVRDRGIMPIGADLRISTYKATFRVQ